MSDGNECLNLQKRVDYLEKVNAECMQALEMFATMGELHGDMSGDRNMANIFEVAYQYLERITELEASGFFVVDEDSGLFELHTCRPTATAAELEDAVNQLIDSGEFAWAINQNRPLELQTSDGRTVLLHVLATRSRIRGMFVGLIDTDTAIPSSFVQHMISIIIHHISYAVESNSLYNMISQQRDNLSEQTTELNEVNKQLRKEVERRSFIEKTLFDSEERLRLSQQIANIATWEWDVEQDNMFWSARAAEAFGHPGSVTETSSERFYRNIIDEDKVRVRATIDEAVSTRGECNTEFRVLLSSGEIRWLQIMAHSSNDTENSTKLLGVVQDITDRKRAQLELINAKDVSEKANRAKSEFLTSMSHEVRTPLNSILGFAQLLEMDVPEDRQSLLNTVAEIRGAGQELLTLINNVLDISKLETGSQQFNMQSVHLNDVILDAIAMLENQLQQKQLHMLFDSEAYDDIYVFADFDRLYQVMINLVSNAIKYNDTDGQVRITVKTDDNGMVDIDVSDTGAGIPEDKHDRVFQPFGILNEHVEETEGTGIGLAISKKIIDSMNGTIRFSSEPGSGTTFTVSLRAASADAARSTPHVTNDIDDDAELGVCNIVYIEDNPINIRVMEQIMSCWPQVTLYTATSAEHGIELVRTRQPDVIMLDILMPEIDGFEALRRLKAMPESSNIPVMAVSADASPETIQRGVSSGFDHYLTKPVDINKLYSVLVQMTRKNQPGRT